MVKHGSRLGSLQIAADRSCLVSRSGSALVAELAARLGLERELSGALAQLVRRRPRNDPGRVLVDLATTLIDGGDCVSDLGVLAEQPGLFGAVASHSTATRLLYALGEPELVAIREARRRTRERAWRLGVRPARITLDFDAQLLDCHTDKEGAGPHREGGFGFHPLHCFLDETGEHLAGVLRPGNAGANTAADHVAVLDAALAQLPVELHETRRKRRLEILARADSAGATHEFAAAVRARDRLLAWLLRRRAGRAGGGRFAEAALAARAQRRRQPPPRRLGGRADRVRRSLRLAGGDAADRAPRAAAPGRTAALHRLRRPPLHLLHHRPGRQRDRAAGAPPPPARTGRRPDPGIAGARARALAVPGASTEPRLV